MIRIIPLFLIAIIYGCHEEQNSVDVNIGMEQTALVRWNARDPSGFLEISDDDVVYFDPYRDLRLDGLVQLTVLYESIRGKIPVDHYDMLNPKVQAVKDMAVLTYYPISYSDCIGYRWNCTKVYRLNERKAWRIIQTHWSYINPDNN